MEILKKKVWKITAGMVVLSIFGTNFAKNFQMEMVDQFIDQKYDYIQMNNNTDLNNNTDN